MDRFQDFINQKLREETFLQDLESEESSMGVEGRVLRNVVGEKENKKFKELEERIQKEEETLFSSVKVFFEFLFNVN